MVDDTKGATRDSPDIPSCAKMCTSAENSSGEEDSAGDSPNAHSPEALAHAARLHRHSIEMIEERVEAMEKHKLAPSPETRPARPLRSMARNSWVLALMAAIVGIIIAAKGRIHVAEPLQGVHATNGIIPYVQPLPKTSIDYLFVNLLIAPYFPPENSSGGGSGGHRRRLAAWVGEAVNLYHGSSVSSLHSTRMPLPDGAEAWAAPHPLVRAEAHAELVQHVRQLLSKPKFMLPQRRQQHRRLLTDDGLSEPANQQDGIPELPQLKVMLMQRNTTLAATASTGAAAAAGTPQEAAAAAALEAGAFFPVSEPQYCTTKDGAAVKCSMSFRGGGLTSAWVQGEPLYLGFQSTQLMQLVFKSEASDLGGMGPVKNWLALAILALVLVGIASERIHRMWCAMIGASLMMSLLLWMSMTPSLAMVVEWLDESTLGLLFGMMIIVGRLKDTGVFELVSAFAVRMSRGKMWLLSVMLMVFTAFVSAWLDNVTTMLLMAPVSIAVMRQCNQDPVPLLLAQALMSNIGGAATMVGDPPALIIGTALSNYIGFIDFIINMAPGVLLASVFCIPLILFLFRRTLTGPISHYDAVLGEVKDFRITDWDLFSKCAYVTGAVLVGFLLHPVHHVDPAWFAVLGAIVLCVCDAPMEVEKVVHTVEWDMLLFFAAMFIMIEASAEVGMIAMIAGWLEDAIRAAPEGSRTIVAIQILLWVSAVVSGVLDNIPYTITMVPVIEYLAFAGLGLELPTLAWALNFGACFGGNATLIGASANIVTATLAERAGERVSFVSWLKPGIPVVIVSVAMADVWMLLRFCL